MIVNNYLSQYFDLGSKNCVERLAFNDDDSEYLSEIRNKFCLNIELINLQFSFG